MPPLQSNNFVVALNKADEPQNVFEASSSQGKPKKYRWTFLFLVVFLFICGYGVRLEFSAPSEFVSGTVVDIPEGYVLSQIAQLFADENIIRSPFLLKVVARWKGNEKAIPAGTYLFKEPVNVFQVALRLENGEHGVARVRTTIPEGMSNAQIKEQLLKTFSNFNTEDFQMLTKGKEGYLFPDTYFFFSNATTGPITETLEENFIKKTADLKKEALMQKKNWGDIITMASLLEEEAVTTADRRIISGILWKRIGLNMPLQVDAPFSYLKGKATTNISLDDINIDSPYNTYKNKGLPPTPIANPGLDSIDAALHPIKTDYLYYLSGKDGVMHYGKTFEEHKLNKAKYLR